MANPFYTDVNATSALVGGESATDAFGFPRPNPTAGLRAPNPQIKAAQDELRTLQAQVDARRQPRQKPPVIGYNPETDTMFSAGKEFDASNLTVMDSYDKAGFFDVDNTGKLPPGFLPYTPDQIRGWMQSEAQSRGVGFRAKEVAKQAFITGPGDLINSGVKALGMLAPKDSWMERSINEAVDEYDRTNEKNTPDVYGATRAGAGFTGAARSLVPSVGTGAALAVNPALGATLLGMMGGGTAYDTYQEALRQGVSHEDAMAAARRTGAIEAVGEGVADRLGYGVLRGAGKVAAGLRIPTLKHGTKVATDLLANAALQAGTEMGQAYGQRRVEEAYGISGQDPMQAALDAGEQGLYLSALMAPLGIAAGYANRPQQAPQLPPQTPPAPPTGTAVGFPAPPSGPFTPVTPIPNPPETSFGGYQQPALPAPSAPMAYDPNTITVTPGGTAAMPGTQNAFSGIQPDMFGGQDTFGVTPQEQAPEATPTPDTQTKDIFDGQIAAMVQTDFAPTALMRELGRTKGARMLAQRLSAALGKQAEVDAILNELNNAGTLTIKNPQTKGRSTYEFSTATVEAANDIVSRFQSRMNDALAQEGVARAQPGTTMGQAPGTQESADLMRQSSEAALEDLTTPDITRSTPNEMDPNLVKEKGPKGPAQTLALRGQTQAQLDELNAREQWLQGPTERTQQPTLGDGTATQGHLFNRDGQPTNPAMGTPLPKSEKPSGKTDKAGPARSKAAPDTAATTVAPKPAPVRAKETAPKPSVPKPAPTPKPLTPTERLQADMEQAQREVRREELPEAPADLKKRMLERLKRLDSKSTALDMRDYEQIKDAIEAGDAQEAMGKMAEIERAMKDGRYKTVSSAGGVSRKIIDVAIKRVQKLLGGKIQIEILDSVTEFDKTQTPGSRAGAYRDGKVYLFRDGMATLLDVHTTIFHELFHRGNAVRHGDAGYQAAMHKFYNQSRAVRNATNAWIASDRGKDARKTYPNDAEYLAVAVDEAMAETAEGLAEPGVVRMVGNWMAEIADWLGLGKLAQHIRTMGRSPLEKFIWETMQYGRGEVASTAIPKGPDLYRTVPKFTGSGAARMMDVLRYDFGGALRRGVLHSSFLTDIAARFSDKLAGLKAYTEKSHLMGATAARLQAAASAVQSEFHKLSAKERDQLSDFMGRVTEANVNVEGSNAHLGQDQSLADALRAEFAKLTPQQKTAYRKTRDQLRSNWDKRGELLARETTQLFKPLIEEAQNRGDFKKAAELKRERDAFLRENQKVLSQMQGDYFPLMRFGNHRVVHKSSRFLKVEAERDAAYQELQDLITSLDTRTPEERKVFAANNKKLKAAGKPTLPEFTDAEQKQIDDAKQKYNDLEATLANLKGNEADYYMAQFESESEARADLARLGKTNAYYSRVAEFHRELNPISRAMMRRMEESLAMTLRGSGNASAVIEAKKAMMEIYLSSLPDLSAMRRQMKRRNVAGYHKDMTRSIAASMLQDSFHLSRLEHMEDVKEAMLDIRREADDAARSGAEDGAKLQEVAEQIERRFAADQRRTDTPVQDTLSGVGWLYNLAMSPAYVITNLMQPGMITLPMLAARHKTFPTMRAMKSAWADTAAMVTKSLKTDFKGNIDFENAAISDKEKEMLRTMLESQLLTVSLVSDLSAAADGKGLSRFTQLTALPAHHAEVVNRIGSALAAYRLEMAATGNHEKATAYAAKVLDQTHFNYSTENAPYWMKPGAGVVPMAKVVLQFRKYTVGMISLYARTVAASVKGESPEVRREARRSLMALLTAQQLMAGATGLPISFPLTLLVKAVDAAFGDDDVEDPEVTLRNALTDLFGKEVATALVKGLPAVADVDLSGRVGSGNLLNPIPYMRQSDTPRGQYAELVLALLGPTMGGVIPNFADGLGHMSEGNTLRAFESFLPKALRDVVKSYRFASEGVTTRGGDILRQPSGIWESFLTASGITPTDITDAYKANAAIQDKRTWFKASRQELVKDWLEADDKTKVMDAIKRYNEQARESNLKPLTLGDLMRARQLQQRRNESYAKYGSNLPRSEVGLAEEGRFMSGGGGEAVGAGASASY